MKTIYQPAVIQQTENVINGLIDAEFFDDYEITDSLLSTPEGLLTYYELKDVVQNDDPYESENFKDEFRNTITRGLSELLAIRIS